jgi:hypothetical protein
MITTMKMSRILPIGLLLAGLALGGVLVLRSVGLDPFQSLEGVLPLEEGQQEIAWIAPATGSDSWERLVAALTYLEKDWQNLHPSSALRVSFKKAFRELSAEVPEISLSFPGHPGQSLVIRWYKVGGENQVAAWIQKLQERGRPPLALIGGETTDRALALARTLQSARDLWKGPAPLFLLTSATAEAYPPDQDISKTTPTPYAQWPKLMEVYQGRMFRFSFTNSRMVSALLEFVQQMSRARQAATMGLALVGQAGSWEVVGKLAPMGKEPPYFFYTVTWWDDGYSKDLVELITAEFPRRFPLAPEELLGSFSGDIVGYSTGEYGEPNPQEQHVVERYLGNVELSPDQQQYLVLPTGVQRARRFLRALCRRAPQETRKMLVLSGDSINFNHVYRDSDVAWNVQDLPVPLVFFSHRNPVDRKAGFGEDTRPGDFVTTGTQDLLFYRDLIEAFALAAYDPAGGWVSDADHLQANLKQTGWQKGRVVHGQGTNFGVKPFFDAQGNRLAQTGEHLVWLQPGTDGSRNLSFATLSVWGTNDEPDRPWKLRTTPLFLPPPGQGSRR